MASRIVLVTGGDGQLASDLKEIWPREQPDDHVVPLSHSELDVTDPAAVASAFASHQPLLVVNTAAYNAVDGAEDEPDRAFAVNAIGPRNLAEACAASGAAFMHISTDYVFSGFGRERGQPYLESEEVEPLSVYAASKVAGEMLVRAACRRHFVVRTSGLYGRAGSAAKGGGFVPAMLGLAANGGTARVVDDQVLTPTSTAALARQLAVLSAGEVYGTYHATCQGECSWYEFAAEIFRLTRAAAKVVPQSSAESGRKAKRPSYSALDNGNLRALDIDRMPEWRDGLAAYLSSVGAVR